MIVNDDIIKKAEVLTEALPYIRKFEGETIVIKYGGSLMDSEEAKEKFCKNIVLLRYVGMKPVVVHGGGKEISRWVEKIGKKAEFIEGLRVTDAETMEVVEMILSGKINSDLVACMNRAGSRAVGLSGKDANLFLAHRIKVNNQDIGFVGSIKTVNSQLIQTLCESGYIPVISSIAVGLEGETLNINADEAAAAVASALSASKLIYLTDVDGILRQGDLVDYLELKDAETLLKSEDISGGMIPKLSYSINAIKNQVASVHIINGNNPHAVLLEIFTDTGVGTMIQHKKEKGKAA